MATTITRISALVAMALALLASRSSAQDAYPTHPVRVIAASAAGGNPDVLARILSARLSEIFNNPFVVEDVPGVGGVIAAKQTAAARPDGYTLGLNDSGSLGISIAMNPDANYTLKDFTPITALARLPTILVIRPDVPANTLAEFVALAKAKPGAMSFGSAGTGSIHQMTMIIFEKAAGISLLHVPYRGGTGLVNALLTGEAKILREPEIAERLKTLGIHLAENGTAAYAKFIQDDLDRYTEIVNEFHLQIKP
jgi:tripartite-type tricarboxylate transporter receptor subunit TctC